MSIYEGTIGEREYAHGRDEGRAAAEIHVASGLGLVTAAMQEMRSDAAVWETREGRAYIIGWLRGYREVVR